MKAVMEDDIVMAPLLDKLGRRLVGWAPTRAGQVTVEQREYMRRLRQKDRSGAKL
jgi:hypothetical protein